MKRDIIKNISLDFMPLVKANALKITDKAAKTLEQQIVKITKFNIEVELYNKDNSNGKGIVLSCMGRLRIIDENNSKNYYTLGGQCEDEFAYLLGKQDEFLDHVLNIWSEYHSNDLQPGTEKQMKFLKDYAVSSYEAERKILEDNDLLFDDGYEYGSRWIMKQIPQDIINDILTWDTQLKRKIKEVSIK